MKERRIPRFTDQELAVAFGYLRGSRKFSHLMPERKKLRVDWFLMRMIANMVSDRRDEQPDAVLPMLVGSVVRECVPDTTPARRELGMAYRNGVMKMLSRRAHLQRVQARSTGSNKRRGPADDVGQRRLI